MGELLHAKEFSSDTDFDFFKYQTLDIQAAHVRKWKSIESEEEGYQGL